MTQSTREDWLRATATRLRAIVEYVRVVFARSLARPEPVEVLATLLHELCHAVLRQGTGHKSGHRRRRAQGSRRARRVRRDL